MGASCLRRELATFRVMTAVVTAKTCQYWECTERIPANHFLRAEHHEARRHGRINRCPKCHRFKHSTRDLCLDCHDGRAVVPWEPPATIPAPIRPNGLEHSDAWAKGDRGIDEFFVYVLKLDNGDFYIGQTNDLRARLSEHRDRKVQSTAGRNPKLQYFEVLPTRGDAAIREAELKRVKDSNPRQIRRMIISFGDWVREIQTE